MTNNNFDELTNIITSLRDPEKGCPWDKKQTHKSLIKYLEEETLELKEAIKNNDYQNMEEELGDVLLQIMLHSQIAKENNKFDINDVIKKLNKKLVRRHPHVFGDEHAKTEEDVKAIWKKVKAKENKE